MTATPNVTTPPAAGQRVVRQHFFFPTSQTRLQDELEYQWAVNRALAPVRGQWKGPMMSQDEMRAMIVAYSNDVTPEQFAQCVLDAHEMDAEKVSA